MKTILGSRKHHYIMKLSILLITAGLLAGMAGCSGDGGYNPPPSKDLEIRTWYDLDDVRDNPEGNHTLMNDLNSTTPGYEELAGPTANGGTGWQPIGTENYEFTGSLDGQGHEIRDLFINRPAEDCVGLFSLFLGAHIENIGVVNVTVTGYGIVGGLAAVNGGTVSNSYFTGNVTGQIYVGGLVGDNGGTISNSYASGNVTGDRDVGGLVGFNEYGAVSDCYFTGNVTGQIYVGGLVGRNERTVTNSHSAGSVTGDMEVGGLVGMNGWCMDGYSNPGTVTNSYSTGSVAGQYDVGGLVGGNGYESIVSDSYATGNVSGDDCAGGLAGTNVGAVEDSYSAGNVTGNSSVGGLVGDDGSTGTVSDSFWDIQTSGQATSAGGTGKNTTEMQDIVTFSGAGWNITAVALNETNPAYIWTIVNNVTYPFLSWQPV